MSDPRLTYESPRRGAPAPPVEPEDVKRVWQFIRTTQQKQGNARGPREAGGSSAESAVSIHNNLVAEHCSPGANASAVFFRCQMLALLMKQRLLAPWQHGEEIDEFLFQVFASCPLHVGNFDVEALLQHIRKKAKVNLNGSGEAV